MKFYVRRFAFLAAIFPLISMAVAAVSAERIGDGGRFNDYYQDEETLTSGKAGCDTPEGCDAAGCDVAGGCDAADCASCGWCKLGCRRTLQQYENCWGISYGGWAQFGYHTHHTPLSSATVPAGSGLSFNDVPSHINAHQVVAYIEKEAAGDCYWDWGFRFDLMYGTDAQKTQAFGGTPNNWDNPWDYGEYGWALPQAYLSFDRDDVTVIAGHFYSLMGYEVVAAPENFFYSHALTMLGSEPRTHTGIVAAYNPGGCDTTYYGGWTMGWDTAFEESPSGGSNFLGGVSTPLADRVTASYILALGDMGARGQGYTHSVVINWQINRSWEYVAQSDAVVLAAEPGVNDGFLNDQIGVNQYLFYTVNDCVKVGVRGEWWKTDFLNRYAVSAGVNIRPDANLVIRPEVRYDWGDGPTDIWPRRAILAIDAVLTF